MILRALIRQLDRLIRSASGVYEFSRDPACLLRVRRAALARRLVLPDGELAPGDPVVEIHLWNEHIPPMPEGGPDLGWATRTARRFTTSMRTLARHVRSDPDLAQRRGLGGVTVLVQDPASEALMRRLGFQIEKSGPAASRFAAFWQNLYALALIWTFNPPSLRGYRLGRMRRVEIWMSMESFLRRYGSTRSEHDGEPDPRTWFAGSKDGASTSSAKGSTEADRIRSR